MNWRIFTIAIVNTLLLGVGIKLALGCADIGDPNDLYVSFFQNNVTAQPQYSPFYFTEFGRLYDQFYWYGDTPEDDAMPDQNVSEWFGYCKGAAKERDIDSALHRFSYTELETASGRAKNNSFCRWLAIYANKEARNYLLLAKQCEPFNASPEADWDNVGKKYVYKFTISPQVTNLIADATNRSLVATNDFMKRRYAFQALRLAYYTRDFSRTLTLYEKLIGNKPGRGYIPARCMALKAGALYRLHRNAEAAYWYSRAFDASDNEKRDAYLSFLWATDSIGIAPAYKMCRNNHERAVLTIMNGLNECKNEEFEGLKLMQKAFALDPDVKGLDVLMTRDINKAELRYMQQRENHERDCIGDARSRWSYYLSESDKWPSEKKRYQKYITDLNTFAQKLAANSRVKDRAFWYISSSYLYYMSDKFPESAATLTEARKYKMNPHERDLADVIDILGLVNAHETITAETEMKLLPCMKWVDKRRHKSVRFAKVYKDLLCTVLTDKYIAQHDTIKALFCLARAQTTDGGSFSVSSDFGDAPGTLLDNMSIGLLQQVNTFEHEQNKTEFEKWLVGRNPYSVQVLKELEGTKYLREMRFEEAVAAFRQVGRKVLSKTELPDMMISHLEDSQDWNASDSAKLYNKLQFAQTMAGLEQKLQQDPSDARAAYRFANGLYNMSYYGRGHSAYTYYRSSTDELAYYDQDRRKLKDYQQEYYGVHKALKYYLVAYENSKDRETKARCLFLAAKCWQKNCPSVKADYYEHSLRNPYFLALYQKYRKSSLYMTAYSTCSYFRDYVKTQR